jgi:hypothetical protein
VVLPVRWETNVFPVANNRPQTINAQLVDTSDILIGLFFARIDSRSGIAISGTVDRFVAAGKPTMMCFS